MTTIYCGTPAEAIVQGNALALRGATVSPRGFPTREVLFPTLHIDEPWQLPPILPGRKANWAIGALEATSIVGQFSLPELFPDVFAKFTKDGVFWGSYGGRIAGQLGLLVETLKSDASSRQAVVTIFDGHRDLARRDPDMPCTIALQFLIRDDVLHLRTMMRSNDAWLGLTYDLVQFAALQGAIAQAVGVPMGHLIHQPGSLHVYDSDVEKIEAMVDAGWNDEDTVKYAPLWGGKTLAEISSRARLIGLVQALQEPTNMTPFETWLADQIDR